MFSDGLPVIFSEELRLVSPRGCWWCLSRVTSMSTLQQSILLSGNKVRVNVSIFRLGSSLMDQAKPMEETVSIRGKTLHVCYVSD